MIRAIALDTNAFPRGKYDAKALERWAEQAQKRSIEIWIAEPVLWELIEHAVADLRALEAAVESRVGPIRKAGFASPIVPLISDPEEHIDGSIRSHPGVVIVPVSGSAAREALKDQILVHGPGERVDVRSASQATGQSKSRTVKTGASDSAWVRAIHAYANHGEESYVVVSKDSDVQKTYAALGWQAPQIFRDFYALRQELHHLRPDEGEVYAAIVRFLDHVTAHRDPTDPHDGRADEGDGGALTFGERFHLPADISDALSPSGGWEIPLSEEERIVRLTAPISVHDVELDADAQVAYAHVTIQGDMERTSWIWDDQGDQLVPTSREVRDVLLHAPLTFRLSRGLVLDGSNDGGEIWASSKDDRYYEATEALDAALEIIAIHSEEELIGTELAELDELKVPSKGRAQLDVAFEGDLWEGEWELSIGIADSKVVISSTFDATSWVGGKDGGFIEPPYTLSVHEGNDRIASPTGRLAEFLMRNVGYGP